MAKARGPGTLPTIADVAAAAGVSTATVSRCLNAPGRVRADTRARVEAAVAALGYLPDAGARSLAARATRTIGAVVPTIENAIFAEGLQAFEETLTAHGMTLLVASSRYRRDEEEAKIRTLLARRVDGLLLIGFDRSEAILAECDRRGVRTIVAWAAEPGQRQVAAGFDNFAAMGDMTRAVLDHGHRRLTMIAGVNAGNDRARRRVEGARAAVAAWPGGGVDLDVVEAAYGVAQGRAAFASLMDRTPRPTAILCGNDVLAVGALAEARARGLDVPGDVSITGFDDIEIARIVDPPLATVHVPHREMGRRAALSLIEMIETGGDVESVTLATDLRLRGTLGPVPGVRRAVPPTDD